MNYRYIIDNMTWSYSRIKTFEDCPYGFFLRYILHEKTKQHQFFSEYGSFVHSILAKFYNQKLKANELANYYLQNFRKNVVGEAPSEVIFNRYFQNGLDYFTNFMYNPQERILAVEQSFKINLNDRRFVGVIDLISKDPSTGEIILTDHKSRILHPRTGKARPTKTDEELDSYLRQLYLYSEQVKIAYGTYPKILRFNCFRAGVQVEEPFNQQDFESAKQWAINTINKIAETENWTQNIDLFKCKNICDMSESCEYFKLYCGN